MKKTAAMEGSCASLEACDSVGGDKLYEPSSLLENLKNPCVRMQSSAENMGMSRPKIVQALQEGRVLKNKSAKPFLKWAGGKYKLAREISDYIGVIDGGTYYEPFLGGASVFFSLDVSSAVLSDENERLINTYQCIRDNPASVHGCLSEVVSGHSSDRYYSVRDLFNAGIGSKYDRAAWFIYLNKAGFNGVYRVNQRGHYNVPAGNRETLSLPTMEDLRAVSERLKNVALVHSDFELAVGSADKGDVVYLDPPYPPLSESAFFTHYTQDRFSSEEQRRVAQVANDLKVRGCSVVVSNADTPEIRALYSGWKTINIELRRWITASKTKHFVKEVLFLSKG